MIFSKTYQYRKIFGVIVFIGVLWYQNEVFASKSFQGPNDINLVDIFQREKIDITNTRASTYSFKSEVKDNDALIQFPSGESDRKDNLGFLIGDKENIGKKEYRKLLASNDLGEFSVNHIGRIGSLIELEHNQLNSAKWSEKVFEIKDHDDLIGLAIDHNGELSLEIPGINEPGPYLVSVTSYEKSKPEEKSEFFITFQLREYEVDMMVDISSNMDYIFEGEEFEYFITVKNEGDYEAEKVIVFNDLPHNFQYLSSSIESFNPEQTISTQLQGGKIVWSIPIFPVMETLVIKVNGKVNSSEGNLSARVENKIGVISEGIELSPENNYVTSNNELLPFFIPNVITPNGESQNDIFEIRGLDQFKANHLVIFNNFLSDLVYESEDYKNDWRADGLDGGMYYYVLTGLDFQEKQHEIKGWLQVIK